MQLRFDANELNPSQRKFLQARDPYLLFSAGFGTGKTTVGGLKVLDLSTRNPGVPGLIVAQSYTALMSTVIRSLNKLMPGGRKLDVFDRQGERYISLDGGRTPIFLRTAHNPDLMDGLDVGWVYADEIRHYTKRAYDIMIGRVRVKCPFPQRAFTSTPSIGWMSEEFDTQKLGRRCIFASTAENAHNLDPDYIPNLRLAYSPRMQRAVLEGKFTILEGAVYEEFDPSNESAWITDWRPSKEFLRHGKVFLAVDPGYRRSSWLFIVERKHPKGGPLYTVFDQIQGEDRSDISVVQEVNERGYPIDELWYDPAARAKQSIVGADIRVAFNQVKRRHKNSRFLRTVTAYRDIAFGVDKLRTLLGGEGLPVRINFTHALSAHEQGKKRGVIKSLGAYRYPELKDGKPVTDVPLKDGFSDHDCDAMRYFGVGRWLAEPWLRKKLEAIGELKAGSAPGYQAA